MAKWVAASSTGGTLQGAIEYTGDRAGESHFQIYQDEKPFIEQAKMEREQVQKADIGYKKFATIPDLVAIEVNEQYGIDIHDADTMRDREKMTKFKKIIKENYAYLLSFQEIMMATTRTYDELVSLVYMWSNRDRDALPIGIVQDSIRYAVDKAYRHLRIPPLEHTVSYTADMLEAASLGTGNVYQSVTALAVPVDLIEFIQIRGVDAQGLTTRVFNEKSDIRSYWDLNNRHYNQAAFWSRQGDEILLTPAFREAAVGYYGGFTGPETGIELYYYRRLPALSATFQVTAANANLNSFSSDLFGVGDTNGVVTVYDSSVHTTATPVTLYRDANNVFSTDDTETPTMLVGNSVPNWFKDENERIALYGALAECFAYLQEDDQAGKYTQLMMKEIEELNEEDRTRDASGGNVQVQYNARGLI